MRTRAHKSPPDAYGTSILTPSHAGTGACVCVFYVPFVAAQLDAMRTASPRGTSYGKLPLCVDEMVTG